MKRITLGIKDTEILLTLLEVVESEWTVVNKQSSVVFNLCNEHNFIIFDHF